MNALTQERLKELFSYDKDTGIFTFLAGTTHSKPGKIAGCSTPRGYRYISADNKLYLSHRLAYLYMKGAMPSNLIDHINGVKDDNRWVNLRPCTHLGNNQNAGIPKRNSSGFKGVYFNKEVKKWHAQISVNRKRISLGFFEVVEDAGNAYKEAANKYHGEFARY